MTSSGEQMMIHTKPDLSCLVDESGWLSQLRFGELVISHTEVDPLRTKPAVLIECLCAEEPIDLDLVEIN